MAANRAVALGAYRNLLKAQKQTFGGKDIHYIYYGNFEILAWHGWTRLCILMDHPCTLLYE
jgi:hypothetical protein